MDEFIFKNKKYLTGFLAGFILAVIIMIGVNRSQNNQVVIDENGVVQNKQEERVVSEQEVEVKEEVAQNENLGITRTITPETPHSPELQRLDLILREAGRMVERMEKEIVKVNGNQTATVSQ